MTYPTSRETLFEHVVVVALGLASNARQEDEVGDFHASLLGITKTTSKKSVLKNS